MTLDLVLRSRDQITFSKNNRYLIELAEALEGADRKDIFCQVAEYVNETDIHTKVPSGIEELDQYLDWFLDLNEKYCNVDCQPFSLEEFSVLCATGISMLTNEPMKISEEKGRALARAIAKNEFRNQHPVAQLYKGEEKRLSQFMVYLLREMDYEDSKLRDDLIFGIGEYQHVLAPIQQPDLNYDPAQVNSLVVLYLKHKPDSKLHRMVTESVVKIGREYHFGHAPCPVDSFRAETIKRYGTPRDFDATQFIFYVITNLIDHGERDLAIELCEDYQETLSIIDLGREGFEKYEEFTVNNCPGCISGSSDCGFMTQYRREVAKGKYIQSKCPQRYGGTIAFSVDDSKVKKLDLSDKVR